MPIRTIDFSIVVVASDANPTILNPDFLVRQAIVPDEWDWKIAGHPITTPPFAKVDYENGVSVLVEPNKIQVVDRLTGDITPKTSKIHKIARRYIEVLPHVRYEAVGHNFRVFVEHTDANTFLREKFLKTGTWDDEKHRMEGFSIKFIYPLDRGRLIISIDDGKVVDRSSEEPKELRGLMVYANYHRDCKGYPSDKQVIENFKRMNEDWDHFQTMLSDILGINDAS